MIASAANQAAKVAPPVPAAAAHYHLCTYLISVRTVLLAKRQLHGHFALVGHTGVAAITAAAAGTAATAA